MALFGKGKKKDELEELTNIMEDGDRQKGARMPNEDEDENEEKGEEEEQNDEEGEEEDMNYVKRKPKHEKPQKRKPLPKKHKREPKDEDEDENDDEVDEDTDKDANAHNIERDRRMLEKDDIKPPHPPKPAPQQIDKEALTKAIIDFAKSVPQVDVESWNAQALSDGSVILIPLNVVGNPTMRAFLSVKRNALKQLKTWLDSIPL